jgi:hypothetical protein
MLHDGAAVLFIGDDGGFWMGREPGTEECRISGEP